MEKSLVNEAWSVKALTFLILKITLHPLYIALMQQLPVSAVVNLDIKDSFSFLEFRPDQFYYRQNW